MALSIDDIVKKDFSHAFMGYDMQEVDVFLDTIIEQVEKMETERAELMETMERLLKRVEVLERANAREKAALKESKNAARKELSESETKPVDPPAVAAPVEEPPKPERREAEKPRTVKHTTHAPLRPVRPCGVAPATDKAQPTRSAEPVERLQPTGFATLAETPAFQPQMTVPVQESVAVEVETGAFAPDPDTLIPDLVSGVEDALSERSVIRAASYEANADRTRT